MIFFHWVVFVRSCMRAPQPWPWVGKIHNLSGVTYFVWETLILYERHTVQSTHAQQKSSIGTVAIPVPKCHSSQGSRDLQYNQQTLSNKGLTQHSSTLINTQHIIQFSRIPCAGRGGLVCMGIAHRHILNIYMAVLRVHNIVQLNDKNSIVRIRVRVSLLKGWWKNGKNFYFPISWKTDNSIWMRAGGRWFFNFFLYLFHNSCELLGIIWNYVMELLGMPKNFGSHFWHPIIAQTRNVSFPNLLCCAYCMYPLGGIIFFVFRLYEVPSFGKCYRPKCRDASFDHPKKSIFQPSVL